MKFVIEIQFDRSHRGDSSNHKVPPEGLGLFKFHRAASMSTESEVKELKMQRNWPVARGRHHHAGIMTPSTWPRDFLSPKRDNYDNPAGQPVSWFACRIRLNDFLNFGIGRRGAMEHRPLQTKDDGRTTAAGIKYLSGSTGMKIDDLFIIWIRLCRHGATMSTTH
jgi:hypothetical protein